MRIIGRHFAALTLFVLMAVFSPCARAAAATAPTTRPATTKPVGATTRPLPPIPSSASIKTTPETVADLRALQAQVEAVVNRVSPCVVGLRVGGGQGSGIIISEDGYVLTAGHVASAPGRDVTVVLEDGKMVKGKALGVNYEADSGLVKISDPPPDGGKWPFVEMGNSAKLQKGQWCIVLGHPGGFKFGRTPVLRLGRILQAAGKFIRTDCTLVGGDSGGPLFDLDGKVIGIHSRIGNSLNDNMHVPVDTYSETWDRLAASEAWGASFLNSRPGAAYLGILPDDNADDCRITEVFPNSPAEKAGLKAGDIIKSFDGQKVANFGELMLKLGAHKVGDEVRIEVKREKESVKLNITIGRRPPMQFCVAFGDEPGVMAEDAIRELSGAFEMQIRTMNRKSTGKLLLALALSMSFAQWASAQRSQFGRGRPDDKTTGFKDNPKMVAAFHDAVAIPSKSVVRVQSAGKNVALGTIVDADGWILTKNSELLPGETPSVVLKDGRSLPAKVVGVELKYDLAMLKVDAKDLTPVQWGQSKTALVGELLAAPGTGSDAVAVGVLSVASRTVKARDLPVSNPPADSGFLGVALEEAEGGARIVQVVGNSAAGRAGLRVGDIVTLIAQTPIIDSETMVNTIQQHKPGEILEIKVKRGTRELEIKATLDKRLPEQLNKRDFQNNMGSELSNRRGGFPQILQHDMVLKPTDCGGPVVDLDGKALGINIARAGRVESYAIPSEAVQGLIQDLKSGKLSPPRPEPTTKPAATNKPAPTTKPAATQPAK